MFYFLVSQETYWFNFWHKALGKFDSKFMRKVTLYWFILIFVTIHVHYTGKYSKFSFTRSLPLFVASVCTINCCMVLVYKEGISKQHHQYIMIWLLHYMGQQAAMTTEATYSYVICICVERKYLRNCIFIIKHALAHVNKHGTRFWLR